MKGINAAIGNRLTELGYSYTPQLGDELYEAYENSTLTEFAQEHPIVASALSVGAILGAGLQVGETVAAGLSGSKNTNEAYIAQQSSSVLRSTAAKEFSEWYHEHPTVVSDIADKVVNKLGGDEADAGVFIYNTLMSAADDLARTGLASVLTYGVGGGSQTVLKALSTAMAASSAMSSAFVDKIENGASAGDALLSSFITAVAEGASEYISLEMVKDGDTFLKTIAKTALSEGLEEVESQVFENILDLVLKLDESELATRWNALKEEGKTDAEAFADIAWEEAKEAGLNFLSGALSAGGTAIGTTGVTQVKTTAQQISTGKSIIRAGQVGQLLDLSQATTGITAETRKAVYDDSIAEKPSSSYSKNVGKLFGEYSVAATQQTVQDRFVELGLTNEQAQTAAAAVVKKMQGKDLNKEEKKALKDPTVKQVYEQIKNKEAGWLADTNALLSSLFVFRNQQTESTVQSEAQAQSEPLQFNTDGVRVEAVGMTESADGEPQIVLDAQSGAAVSIDELQPTDERSAAVQEVLSGESIGTLGKDFLLTALQLDGGDSGNIEAWLAGYEEYYKAGLQGFRSAASFEKVLGTDDIGAYLTLDQKELAIAAGLSEKQYASGVTWLTNGDVQVSGNIETEAAVLDTIGKEYGIAFVLTDNADGVNGWYGKGNQSNRIVLSLDAEGGILTAAAGHEVFHYLKENAPDAAKTLQRFVLQRLLSTEGFDLNAELAKYESRYAIDIEGLTEKQQRSYLLEEMTADSMFGVFSSKQAVELYARKHPKDAKKVAKAISNFLKKVKSALETLTFKGLGPVATLREQYDTLDEISRQFFAALEEAKQNRLQNKNTAESGGVEIRYSIKTDTNGEKFVEIDDDFSNYTSETKLTRIFAILFKEKFNNIIKANGQLIRINSDTTTELLNSGYTRHFIPDQQTYDDKMNSIVNADELLIAAEKWVGEERNHKKNDKFKEMARGKVNFRLDGRGYTAETVVGIKASGDAVFYDLVSLQPKKITEIQEGRASQNFPSRQVISVTGDTLSQNSENVNTDEQFSEKLSSDTQDYVTRLQQENADLQAALEAAKAELHETRGLTVTDKELRKISDFFADTLQSDLTRDDLFKTLRGIFNYVADGGDLNVALGTLTDVYLEAMQTSHSEMLWTELHDGQKEVLTDLRTNPVYLSEIQAATVESNFDGYKNFQRASFGKIRFVKNHDGNHATLDARWSELCDLSHGLLDVNTPDYAQPEALLDYYAATKPMWLDTGNPHGTTQQELSDAAYSMAWSTLMEYMDAPKYQTFADKAAAKVRKTKRERDAVWKERFNRFRENQQKELADQRDVFNQRMQDLREHRDEKLDEQKEYYLQRIDRIRERRRETDDKNSLRRTVRRGAKRLGELLVNETDQKHVPEALKAQISTFLDVFSSDTSTFSDSKLLALQAAYNEYGKDEENATMFDEDIAARLEEVRQALHGKRLTALTTQELQVLKDLTQHFTKLVRDGNKIFYLGRREAREAVGERAVAAYTKDDPKRQIVGSKIAETLLHTNMLTPNSFFELLQGPLAECYERLLYHDQDVFGRHILQGTQFLQDMKNEHAYSEWKNNELVFTTQDGDEIRLSADEVCMLWATWKREHTSAQQARHLEEGGIVFKDELARKGKRSLKDRLFTVRDGSAHRLSYADFDKISEFMTPQMREFTDALVGFLSNDASEWGNAVSLEKYGIKKFTEKYYIPFNTASNYNFRKFGTDVENGTNRLMTRSWTKHTVRGANTPVIVDNLTAVWSGHVAEMAQYSAFALTLDSMEQIFNYRSQENGQVSRVSSIISTYYGQKYMDYFTTYMTDLNGKNYTDPRDNMISKLTGKHKKAAVMLSMSVAVQQPTSYFRALQELGITSMAVLPGTKETYAEMLEYAPGVTLIKEVGGFDSLVGKSMEGYISQDEHEGISEKIKAFVDIKDSSYRDEVLGLLPSVLDKMTWQSIWKATKNEVQKKTGLEGTALLTETGRLFTKIVNDTQVYGSVLAQSHSMRSKSPMMRIMTAFMAEPTVNYNMLLRVGREAKNGNIGKAAAIGVSLLLASIAQGVLKSLVTASRDDDEDKAWIEKYLKNLVGELVGNLPFNWIVILKDIVSWVQGYDLNRDDLSAITDLLESIASLWDEDMPFVEKMRMIVTAVSSLVGVPLGNAWKDTQAVVNVLKDIINGKDFDITESSLKYSIAEEFSFWSSSILSDMGLTYDSSKEKYFERAFQALLEGDLQTYNDTLDYIRRQDGVDEKDIQNGIVKQISQFSEDAFSAAISRMIGDTSGYDEGIDALVALGLDEETAIKGVEKVQTVYGDLLKDAAEAELNGSTAERENAIAQLTDILGDRDKIEDLYADTLEDLRNADSDGESVKLRYKVADVAAAIKAGNAEDAVRVVQYLLDNGTSATSIKSAVSEVMKPLYAEAFGSKDYVKQSEIIDSLMSLGVGYDADDFKSWEDEYHKSSGYWYTDVNEALRNGDIDYALTAIEYIENTGRDSGTIKSQITPAFKSDYVAAVNSGNTAEAERIADALIATGLYEQKNLDQWVKTAGKKVPEGYEGTTTDDLHKALDTLNRADVANMKTALIAGGMTEDELAADLEAEFKPMYWQALQNNDFAHWDAVKTEIVAMDIGITAVTYSEWMSEFIDTYGVPRWMYN